MISSIKRVNYSNANIEWMMKRLILSVSLGLVVIAPTSVYENGTIGFFL
jgi:hypothetical protein